MSELHPVAVFSVGGDPDWVTVTESAVWVTSDRRNRVVRLNPTTDKPDLEIEVKEPCSGLAVGFGSIWVPSCGEHGLVRVDAVTGSRLAVIRADPADSEGGITVGAGSVWLATSAKGELTRVDATTNRVVAKIQVPAGSFNPLFAEGAVWVTCHDGNTLVRVDPATNRVTAQWKGAGGDSVRVGYGAIWLTDLQGGRVLRLAFPTDRPRTQSIRSQSGRQSSRSKEN